MTAFADWYEGKREGLGLEFSARVREAVENIKLNPHGYAPMFRDVRRVRLEQFRAFSLWFQVKADYSLVVACLSGRMNPSIVKEIASGVRPIKPPEP